MGTHLFCQLLCLKQSDLEGTLENCVLSSFSLVLPAKLKCQEFDQTHNCNDLHSKVCKTGVHSIYKVNGPRKTLQPPIQNREMVWPGMNSRRWVEYPAVRQAQDLCSLGKIATSCFKVNRYNRLMEMVLKAGGLSNSSYKMFH